VPNVFGESPALHVSRNDRAAFDELTTAAVTASSRAKGIQVDATWLRRRSPGDAFRRRRPAARRARSDRAGGAREYLIALSQAPRMPGWMRR